MTSLGVIHSVLSQQLAGPIDAVLAGAGLSHVRHGDADPVGGAAAAVADESAIALIGPYRSRDVAEVVEVTAPASLPLLGPAATWAGVTRDDEPGCDDPARHQGTVFRLLARDTEVAARVAADVRAAGHRAFVAAGTHEYGVQLDGQLLLAKLPRAERAGDADVVVFCGFPGEPEVDVARGLAPLPVLGFDGAQGVDLGSDRDVYVALPFAPSDQLTTDELFAGLGQARRAAELVVDAVRAGASDRRAALAHFRAVGLFDAHGDPVNPDVWLWRARPDWSLEPMRELPSVGAAR